LAEPSDWPTRKPVKLALLGQSEAIKPVDWFSPKDWFSWSPLAK
jgi:hypothetical protein